MKRLVSLMAAVLFCFAVSVPAFADNGFVDKPVVSGTVDVSVSPSNKELSEYYDTVLDWAINQRDLLVDIIDTELLYFFTVLVDDSYAVSTGNYKLPNGTSVSGTAYSIRAKSGNNYLDCFNPDYLHAYFDIFKRCMNDYAGADFMASTAGYSYAPNTNSAIAYTSPLYPLKYDFDSFSDYYNALYADYLKENGQSGISVGYENENPEKYVQPIKVPAEDFKKYIDETELVYYPTGRINKISFKTDPIFSSSDFDYFRYNGITFLYNGNFFKQNGLKDMYCALFYYDGTTYYYSQNGFHFYLDDWSDSDGGSGTSLFYDQFNFLELADVSNDNEVFENIGAAPYIKFFPCYSEGGSYGGYNKVCSINGFSDLSVFLKNRVSGGNPDTWFSAEFSKNFISSTSITSVAEYLLNTNQKLFTYDSPYRDGYNLSVNNVPCDWGFIYSDTKFTMDGLGADIDTTKIPDTYYITVSGDTIYDYSITNPDTGDTSTINEYITNNYTYITNNNPGGEGGGSGGTTGGNVNVGGNVGVNGNVTVGGEVKFGGEVNVGVDVSPIDINVNVSGGGDSENGGGDPPELKGVDDYAEYLPEKSPVISQYLKIFFDCLPPELLNLILAGVATAIIILIFRK